MKLPITWLKRYIDVPWTPEQLAEALTLSGTKVEHLEKKSGESVLELEITTNRPDCLSMLGLAQEVAVLTGNKIKFPKILKSVLNKKNSAVKPLAIIIEDPKGCPKYTARLIQNVTVRPSPVEIQNCLGWMGTRPVNQVVDATNFVLFETGQPLHAFDYDKLIGRRIVVRRSRAGERFLGLDGTEVALDEKTLVIADAQRPVAIAGVMGGKLTEVTEHTKNILLESACFDLGLVRQASRKYKLFTESSYRFERGVNPGNILSASARACDLTLQWDPGASAGPIFEKGPRKEAKAKPILLPLLTLEKMTGLKISLSRTGTILKNLGFNVRPIGADKILVTPPGSRGDIQLEADLIEEVLRIEGFDKVRAALPMTRHPETPIQDPKATGVLKLKQFLSDLGFREIITVSLISEKALVNAGFTELGRAQKIVNPLSAEQAFLRPLLLPGMLQTILYNVSRKADALKLFEIGNRYAAGVEATVLAVSIYGNLEDHWRRKIPASFYDLKGITENILDFLKIKNVQWHENDACPKYKNSSTLTMDGKKIGTLGDLSQPLLGHWDIARPVIYGELVLDGFFKKSGEPKIIQVKPLPKYPLVHRDVAFMIDERVSVAALETLMKKAALPYLSKVRLFDEYTGKNIASGKRSLAFSLAYQKNTGTFADEEINALQTKISEALKNTYQVEFR